MSVITVLQSIATRWDDESLDSAISGGLAFGQSPKKSDPPYAELVHIGTSLSELSTKDDDEVHVYEEHEVRFVVHHNEGPAASSPYIGAIIGAFDRAPLTISDGDVISCRRTSDTLEVEDTQPGAILVAISYTVLTAVAALASPT